MPVLVYDSLHQNTLKADDIISTLVPPVDFKQNGKFHDNVLLLSHEQKTSEAETGVARVSINGQIATFNTSQVIDADEKILSKSNDNVSAIPESGVETQRNEVTSEAEKVRNTQSIAIPEGLAMDPLAPTALAVSHEFMERLGNGLSLLRDHGKKVQKYVWKNRSFEIVKKTWKSVVNVVLVEARDLPDGPATGSNGVYCKFKLGSETHKSKQVSKSKSKWCERFNLYLYEDNNLDVTVWHKGKQKNFMGRCIIDLSHLEKEKTHEIWQKLDCGYGQLHLVITLSGTARTMPLDSVPTANPVHAPPEEDKFNWYRLDDDWSEVGELSVSVVNARGLSALGLSSKVDAYCVLELDNARVQTHVVRGTSEPVWNKSFMFDVKDISSTLDISVYDQSILTSLKGELLGKISIPLLRINNEERRWYALKDRSKKYSAKGNCPRILLEMSIVWNPVKASLRLLRPKEKKYTQKPPKFSIPLIYSNLKFIKDAFDVVYSFNENLKRLFEWENREVSLAALISWLVFWFFLRLWMAPLLILVPFVYYWTSGIRACKNNALVVSYPTDEESDEELEINKDEKTIKARLYGLQDLTLTIKNGIDYIVSLLERIYNLVNFTVPYLSFLAMIVLVAVSVALYVIPINYLFMAIGIYKFSRKVLNPDRVPNNDILDFISRVPDHHILKEWRELKVPEPILNRANSTRR